MKFLTNKEYEKRIEWAREGARLDYEKKALTLDLIGKMFEKDFSTMSIDEIDEFFHWCSADVRMYQFCRGMEAGTNSIVDAFEECGLARKHTLEKLRFRANKTIHDKMEECKEKINES
jgi:hypothetical protein